MIKTDYKFIDDIDPEIGKSRHLHTLRGLPLFGNTTALGVISKNLTWWSAECAAVECLETGEKIPTIREEYLNACNSGDKKKGIDELQKKYPIFKKARFSHYEDRNKKADTGTDMHSDLEEYIKFCIFCGGKPIEYPKWGKGGEKLELFSNWAINNVNKFLVSEGHCYSENLWLGGIVDCIYEDKEKKVVVLDFKSSKEVYKSQFLQCAGLDIMASESGILDKDGNLIYKLENPVSYYGILPFGAVKPEPKFYYDTNLTKKIYSNGGIVDLYKFINNK